MNGNKKIIIDAHCHYFNGVFALREAITIGWNKMWGNYPYKTTFRAIGPQKFAGSSDLATEEGWKDLISYVADLLKVILQSCEENYNYDMVEFKNSNLSNNTNLLTAPLMMDIYFILDDNKSEESSRLTRAIQAFIPSRSTIAADNEQLFKEYVVEIKKQVYELIDKKSANSKSKLNLKSTEDFKANIEVLFQSIEKEFITEAKDATRLKFFQKDDLSPGYKKHLNDLEDLKKSKKDTVFPFIAIDPRRHGIMNLIEQYINCGNGPFKGIKLYPPLGYLPSHPNLLPVYEYCIQYDIPITVHTSSGGLPNFKNNIYVQSFDTNQGNKWVNLKEINITPNAYFADPDKWLPVLDKFKNLRLNFAHFGGSDQCLKYPGDDNNWTKKIINIMKNYADKHPNIFCDMSYYTEKGLDNIINNQIISDYPIVKDRLMFGTDYIMIMMEYNLGGLKNYYNLYPDLHDEQYFKNAKRFLKLEEGK